MALGTRLDQISYPDAWMSYAHARRNQIDFVGHARKTYTDLGMRLRKSSVRTKRKRKAVSAANNENGESGRRRTSTG